MVKIQLIEKFSAPVEISGAKDGHTFAWYFEKDGPKDAFGAHWGNLPHEKGEIPEHSQVIDHAILNVSRAIGRRLSLDEIEFSYYVYRTEKQLDELFENFIKEDG